jgi:hypothetical protein
VFPACLFQLTRASLARGRCACAGKPASQSLGLFFVITASPSCHPGPCGRQSITRYGTQRRKKSEGHTKRDQRREYWVPRSSRGMTVEIRIWGLHYPTAPLPPPWQGKQRDKRRGAAKLRQGASESVAPARERTQARTCSRKLIKACHGCWRFPGTACPFLSNCHPGPTGVSLGRFCAPGLSRGSVWVPARRPGHNKNEALSHYCHPHPSSPGRSQDRDPVISNQPCKRSPGLTTALRLSVVLDIASLVLIKSGDDNRRRGRRHPAT